MRGVEGECEYKPKDAKFDRENGLIDLRCNCLLRNFCSAATVAFCAIGASVPALPSIRM